MASVKIYRDEDVHKLIADALRLRGWGALTTVDAGNQGATDIAQLRYAVAGDYSFMTYNVADFPRLHDEFLSSGNHHAGIIVATQDRPNANARALLALVSTFQADDFVDQLIYLNNWLDT